MYTTYVPNRINEVYCMLRNTVNMHVDCKILYMNKKLAVL
jgi:hypothetical protein